MAVVKWPPTDPPEAVPFSLPLEEEPARAMLDWMADDFEHGADMLRRLVERRQGLTADALIDDARMTAWRTRRSIDAMDRLGWPTFDPATHSTDKGGDR